MSYKIYLHAFKPSSKHFSGGMNGKSIESGVIMVHTHCFNHYYKFINIEGGEVVHSRKL